VVCDAALGGSSLSWTLVEPTIAPLTRLVTYDRAGFGWSDAGPFPRTAGRIADELHLLLQRASIPAPYVLVGHSYGGLVMRLFTARYPAEVAALVLIEPAVPEDWIEPSPSRKAHMARGVRLCGYGITAARLGIARAVSWLASIGAIAAARAVVGVVSRGGLARGEDEGLLAPIWRLPLEARRVLRRMWIQRRFYEALRSQIEMVCEGAGEVLRESPAHYGDLPLVVITAASADAHRLQVDGALALTSTRGRHVLVENSGHWVPLDAPAAVGAVIADTVRALRT
jgi:pimeloyl-ACP methyl ester carboxylesterase